MGGAIIINDKTFYFICYWVLVMIWYHIRLRVRADALTGRMSRPGSVVWLHLRVILGWIIY